MDNVNAGRYEVESTAAQKPRKDVSGRWSTAQARAKTYLLNTAVDILLLDMGNRARMYQLLVGEQRYQINDAMLKVLEFLRSPRSLSEIEEKIRKENLRLPSGKQLEELVEDYLLHKKILVLEGENRNPPVGATVKK